ncbi:Hypothetical protein R9X50_00712400 [Acrodontium crateriforme]|uniref:CAP-Gly domain-containing protein n=1 Tax=Acrodontium crateriforme TaxID=150365 RepID=A0AAQ3MAV2_9PEZI|nr:Hypothetical protein R9X50_00712400 [Acrodontium crateriforme]
MATMHDVPLLITSENSSSERRITPAWTISQLKARLEPITGVPANCQKLNLKIASQASQPIEGHNEDTIQLSQWPLQPYAEIHVVDTRPPGMRPNYTDVSAVEHYELPKDEYENRKDTVLAFKKAQKLGRFDPNAPNIEQQKIDQTFREVEQGNVKVNARCRLLPDTDHRRGRVAYIGEIPEIPGVGAWVGIALDEPTGKNDGCAKETRYFECAPKHGVFVRADRVEVGDFPALDEFADDDDDEF